MLKKLILICLSAMFIIKSDVFYNFTNKLEVPVDIEVKYTKLFQGEKFTLKPGDQKKYTLPEGFEELVRLSDIVITATTKGFEEYVVRLTSNKTSSRNFIFKPGIIGVSEYI